MILDGNAVSEDILKRCKAEVERCKTKPKLAIILVGDNPASRVYVNIKQKRCKRVGIETDILVFDETTDEAKLKNKIEELNNDKTVSAIIVQLPLPKHIAARKVLDAISIAKDVDCLTSKNLGLFFAGEGCLAPCTPKGIIKLLEAYNIGFAGKNAVVIGRSNLVGKPIAALLQNKNCTVTVCHSHTTNLKQHTKNADILVSAVGTPNTITGLMVKNGSAVVDVGISKINGELAGDVDFGSVKNKAAYITPVPGGVGPMTVACLIENILFLHRKD